MNEQLLNYFSRFTSLTEEEKEAIGQGMKVETFKRGTVLLEQGQFSSETYFVLNGCVRLYYLADGEEHIKDFFIKNQFVTSLKSNMSEEASGHYLDCVCDSELLVGNRNSETDIYQRFPRLLELSMKIMQESFEQQQKAISRFLSSSAEQRYLDIIRERPELINLVPQYQLASYIGIKPESLSRIKKRVRFKG